MDLDLFPIYYPYTFPYLFAIKKINFDQDHPYIRHLVTFVEFATRVFKQSRLYSCVNNPHPVTL